MRDWRSGCKTSGQRAETVLLHFGHVGGAVAGVVVGFCAVGAGAASEGLNAPRVIGAEGCEVID